MSTTQKITRYGNRKLYSHTDTHYLNLQEIGDHVRDGVEVVVTDSKTKAEITPQILRNIVEQNEAAIAPGKRAPLDLVTRIIRAGGLVTYAQQLEARSAQ